MNNYSKLLGAVVGACVSLGIPSEARASDPLQNEEPPPTATSRADVAASDAAAAVELTIPTYANVSAAGPESMPESHGADTDAYVDANTTVATNRSSELDPVALDAFRSELDPYGTWYDDPNYGRVWVPAPAYVGETFAPYVTNGQWGLDTDDNWIWMSDYPFGSVVYHYGRWTNIDGLGWSWIPGAVYAPAWVVWRVPIDGFAYVGWAPAPPVYGWFNSRAAWLAYNRPVPFVFCPSRYAFYPHFGAQLVRDRLFAEQLVHHSIWNPHTSSYGRRVASPTLSRASVPQSAIPVGRVASRPHVLRVATTTTGSLLVPRQASDQAGGTHARGLATQPAGPRPIAGADGLFEPRHTIRLGGGALAPARQGFPSAVGYREERARTQSRAQGNTMSWFRSRSLGSAHSGVVARQPPQGSGAIPTQSRSLAPAPNATAAAGWGARQSGNQIGLTRGRSNWLRTFAPAAVPWTTPGQQLTRPRDPSRATAPQTNAQNLGFSGAGFPHSSPATRSFGGGSFGARSSGSAGFPSSSPATRSFGGGSFGARGGGSFGARGGGGMPSGGGSFGARGGGRRR